MGLAESELTKPAFERFKIEVLGGDAVFLTDRRLGHKIYMAPKRMSRPELRRYVATLNNDLKHLSIQDFFAKYGLKG
ncbi:MAG: hypothetical protein QME62_04110 [Armatimonadota bacterium]|nr:hypothetical protein [Armatimonadota bacterium]